MKKILKFTMVLITIITLFINPATVEAASGTFKVTTNRSTVVVGNTFTVTVKVSSGSALGTWEYTIDYNSSVLSLVSGKKSVADYGNGSSKSQSYTYTFKAIKSGSSNISVKSYGAYDWNEQKLSCSASGTSVKVITQAELQASYSKDNNLKSLSVNNSTITPAFNKDVTEYRADFDSNTTSITINATKNDSKASLSGTGTFDVTEGENKFEIIVTAENGSSKTYTLIANVIDPNPITVNDVNGNELTVVKRSSLLVAPTSYTETKATINGQEIPALTSDITKYILVGLKDKEGNVNLYIYKDNKYIKYTELKLNELVLLPLESNENYKDYIRTKIKIGNEEIEAFKLEENSRFAVIHALNTENGKDDYYTYDIKNNTATSINEEEINKLNIKLKNYQYIIYGLLGETAILFIILTILLTKKIKHNKKRKQKIEEAKEKLQKKTSSKNDESEEKTKNKEEPKKGKNDNKEDDKKKKK